MIWIECGIVLAVAIAVTIALTPIAKRIAFATDAIDYPDNRRVNTRPTPRMGGVAIFGGMVASCLVIEIGVMLFGWIDPFLLFRLHCELPCALLGDRRHVRRGRGG